MEEQQQQQWEHNVDEDTIEVPAVENKKIKEGAQAQKNKRLEQFILFLFSGGWVELSIVALPPTTHSQSHSWASLSVAVFRSPLPWYGIMIQKSRVGR